LHGQSASAGANRAGAPSIAARSTSLQIKGLADNSPEEQVRRHTVSTTRFIEIFSGRSRLMPGDTFAMEFAPGKGTQFFIAGQPQGAPVGDDEFFQMVLKIWVGASPADAMLKDALLANDKP
jgi:hypothetical protein